MIICIIVAIYHEIPSFDLRTYLNTGGLPAIYGNPNYSEELRAYTGLYLKEEIREEALTRNISSFAEFMELLALTSGEELSYSSLASDCGVSPNSIKNYIEILKDTLIAFELPSFTKTRKRKAISRSKLYLFDVGVTNSLARRGKIEIGSELFGKTFEYFLMQEIRAYLSYTRKEVTMSYFRSTSQFEVDLILDKIWALEFKGVKLVHDRYLKGLRALKEEGIIRNFAIVSLDAEKRKTTDGILIYPWKNFLDDLWSQKLPIDQS